MTGSKRHLLPVRIGRIPPVCDPLSSIVVSPPVMDLREIGGHGRGECQQDMGKPIGGGGRGPGLGLKTCSRLHLVAPGPSAG